MTPRSGLSTSPLRHADCLCPPRLRHCRRPEQLRLGRRASAASSYPLPNRNSSRSGNGALTRDFAAEDLPQLSLATANRFPVILTLRFDSAVVPRKFRGSSAREKLLHG